jgi:hypothetical protein
MKPTLRQVELALGVKAEDWDCVDPEELINTIYQLSVEEGTPVPDKSNVHPLQVPKIPGKGGN